MKPKNAEELREEFIKKYAPSILDKNSNTSFVLDLAVLLESFASLREDKLRETINTVCRFDTGTECLYRDECPYLNEDEPKCSQQ